MLTPARNHGRKKARQHCADGLNGDDAVIAVATLSKA